MFEEEETEIRVCAVSVAEFGRRLVALGYEAADARARVLDYVGLMDDVVPVDTAVAIRAFELGGTASGRVPLVVALIAAAAQIAGATLLHGDRHFAAISSVEQEEIR